MAVNHFLGAKPWYKSRGVWSAILQILASGIVAMALYLVNGDANALLAALGFMFKGFYDLYVRVTTNQPIG